MGYGDLPEYQKNYDNTADDGDSSASSSSSMTSSSGSDPPRYVDVLYIIYAFENGDTMVSYWNTKTRICSGTPLPDARSTITIHKNANTTPPPSATTPSSGDSAAANAAAAAAANSSDSLGISQGSINTNPTEWSETKSPYSTKPTSGTPASTTPSMSPAANQESPIPSPPPPEHHSPPPIGALVVIPLAVIAALIAALVVWRKKRRVRRAAAGMTQEMKMTRGPEDGLPQYTPAPTSNDAPLMSPPLMSLAASHTGTTTSLAPTASAAPSIPGAAAAGAPAEQPVILSSGMGGAYFTGIDTSDAVSMTSSSNHASSGNMHSAMASNRMSLDARSMTSNDEPPPPYRPRSVPPISRETSLRQPNAPSNISQMLAPLNEGALMGANSYEIEDFRVADGMRNPFEGGSAGSSPTIGEGMDNPFDDPDDASVISDNSTPVSPLVERDEGGHVAMGGVVPGARPGQEV